MNGIKKQIAMGMLMVFSVSTLTGCNSDLLGKIPFLSKNGDEVIEEVTLKEFQTIDLDVPLADVVIRTGDEFRMDVERAEGYPVEAKVKNKQLVVRKGEEASKGTCKLEISIPKKKIITKAICKVDVGDVKLEGITARQMKVQINVGDCEASRCDLKRFIMHSETGDVLLDKPIFIRKTVLKLSSEQGTITVNGKKHKSPFRNRRNTNRITKIGTNLGDIVVKRKGYEEEVKAKSDNKKTKDTKKAKAAKKTKNTKNSKAAKKTKNTKKAKTAKKTKNSKTTKNTKNSKSTKNTKNSKATKNTRDESKAKKN